MTKDSVKDSVMREGRNGGKLLSGNPGNKGGYRTRDAWQEKCREIADSEEVLQIVREVLSDKGHSSWLGVWKFVTEQGYGRAVSSLDLNANLESKQGLTMEEAAPMIARILGVPHGGEASGD